LAIAFLLKSGSPREQRTALSRDLREDHTQRAGKRNGSTTLLLTRLRLRSRRQALIGMARLDWQTLIGVTLAWRQALVRPQTDVNADVTPTMAGDASHHPELAT
jgi:hypothetical protein